MSFYVFKYVIDFTGSIMLLMTFVRCLKTRPVFSVLLFFKLVMLRCWKTSFLLAFVIRDTVVFLKLLFPLSKHQPDDLYLFYACYCNFLPLVSLETVKFLLFCC